MDVEKVETAIGEAKGQLAFLDSMGMVTLSRKAETAGQVAEIVREACIEEGIEIDSKEYDVVIKAMLKHAECEGW